jgi:hypothetical protein
MTEKQEMLNGCPELNSVGDEIHDQEGGSYAWALAPDGKVFCLDTDSGTLAKWAITESHRWVVDTLVKELNEIVREIRSLHN